MSDTMSDIEECVELDDEEALKSALVRDPALAKKRRSPTRGPLIFLAAKRGKPRCLRALIEAGADLEAKTDHDQTPLILAAKEGKFECVEILINAGANVHAQDDRKKSPVIWSCMADDAKSLRALIAAGVDVSRPCNNNDTALMWATARGYPECVRELIAAGAELDAENEDGRTAMSLAESEECRALIVAARERALKMDAPWKESFKLLR